ncbi:GNAT family N-acetyltransferase [Aquipseudomonas alcaligenes]|uniref:L-methionine sulfoximine/L-methionine sulfone acetyltransferase n=1 Tax=Aquipseudomonas alcaligenes TaxID=43263 RepID=A0AA37CDA6_AQUAC|nr:GNAT family N-acetyltransferase [Pseudomonas alcaligenes]BCR25887.1 N-acetyltransferase [Pseudomonas alcaligenes]GIZ66435.1 N-acetyltransferase [Pseudomonas alcaligenes]GIZ70768.1 N-acetyltransferase [Pseudomonas alcaligenes]GIZ75122.1 N-acetyltransferase [Pseudomonas alcaligenes]GIZ79449.1 N-acetyltransferase [Pseudomonas alcaligenes]
MIIRDAAEADLPALRDIFNDAVLNTTAIWMDNVVDLANRQAWFAARAQQGYPILVAENAAGEVVGYASFGDWRPFDGFCHTVEHSVYIRADQRGKGLGPLLLAALIERAKACDKHVMVAAIESGNAASIRLHQRLGFAITGQMPQVGRKFGRWLDLTFMQLILTPERSAP